MTRFPTHHLEIDEEEEDNKIKVPECCYCDKEGWCICDKCNKHVCLSHIHIFTYFGNNNLKDYTCYGCEYGTFKKVDQ